MSVSYPSVISGYLGNTGALSFFNPFYETYVSLMLPSTQFVSYCIGSGNDSSSFYGVDENYAGSTLYQFEKMDQQIDVSKIVSNRDVLGAVFILQHDSFLYVPGIGSDNLWVVHQPSFETRTIVPTGPKPHGIYFYEGVFYVPCRGDENNNANLIFRYKNDDLSVVLDPIDLNRIERNTGPRHLAFVGDFMYVVTEFSCQIIKMDLYNNDNQKTVTMIDPINPDATGSEIVHHNNSIYATVRIKDQPGYFIGYNADLNEKGRLRVGINPRFFNFSTSDDTIILNQDDQSFTVIDVRLWKVTSTVTELQIHPQCFV